MKGGFFMERTINIKNKRVAIEQLSKFKSKKYTSFDIKFENVHLRRVNKLIRKDIFFKNDLYVNSITLWEIMQPLGKRGGHNYHGLNHEDIIDALNGIIDPYCIFRAKLKRYAIIPIVNSLMVVIEIGAKLRGFVGANINKLVTVYQKKDIEKILNKMSNKDILYRK